MEILLFFITFAVIVKIAILLLQLCAFLLKCFLAALLWLAGKTLILAARLLLWLMIAAGRGLGTAVMLLVFVIIEAVRGPPPLGARSAGPDGADEEPGPDPAPAPEDAYAAALALFGLSPGFGKAALEGAYKQAIRRAHPDAGGTKEQAQAVNAARDLVKGVHGWA